MTVASRTAYRIALTVVPTRTQAILPRKGRHVIGPGMTSGIASHAPLRFLDFNSYMQLAISRTKSTEVKVSEMMEMLANMMDMMG